MKLESENPEISHSKSESGRELVYANEFKQLIHENPGIIASFRKLEKEAEEKYKSTELKYGDSLEDAGLRLTAIWRRDLHPGQINVWKHPLVEKSDMYFKAEIGSHAFFIKRTPGLEEDMGGVQEFFSMQRAKEKLKDFPGVEVVDFQLGYQDNNNVTYFVSKWTDGIRLDRYLESLIERAKTEIDSETRSQMNTEFETLEKTSVSLRRLLEDDFWDVQECNMLFNSQSKKITVFDIHSRPSGTF
ncbi:MAG: hypothetical protein PHS53_03810 [Candidatus Pacebacteria bacterium]|nr:hypothetical protein [Candidatus Paceibacterota bacterium]MDD5357243.1 hypothetical protein [Candidatus Paceibacterota bacterium]